MKANSGTSSKSSAPRRRDETRAREVKRLGDGSYVHPAERIVFFRAADERLQPGGPEDTGVIPIFTSCPPWWRALEDAIKLGIPKANCRTRRSLFARAGFNVYVSTRS